MKRRQLCALLLAFSIFVTFFSGNALTAIAASEPEISAQAASDVIYNWGTRGEECTELSSYAEAFYSGIYVFEDMSKTQGGTSQSNAYSSALYIELRDLMVNNHTHRTSYDETKNLYKYTDCENGGGKISSFYSGVAIGPSWGSSPTWNREHTWPNSKGLGGSDENDIMMLRPTAQSENSSRGNTAYGQSSGYYHPNSESNGQYDLRGDVARICLYIYTRWGNTTYMWGSSGVMESLTVLLSWMEEDPVDTWEMGRNDSVQSITGTRNVFVDYPEYAWLLFGRSVPEDYTTPSNSDTSSIPGNTEPAETEAVTAAPEQGETPETKDSVKYIFSDHPAGEQYAKNEIHVLDDTLTVVTNKAHFTEQLRLYKDPNAYAIFKSSRVIDSMTVNAGHNSSTLNVWGSKDGENWTLADTVPVRSAYDDYDVSLSGMGYTYLKLASGGAQIRIEEITLNYIADSDETAEETSAPEITTEDAATGGEVTEDVTTEDVTTEDIPTAEETTAPAEDGEKDTVKYIFKNYPAGEQYAQNEVHVLDDVLTITTNNTYFTEQLRLYQDSNAYAILEALRVIDSVTINAGYKSSTLIIWGSSDGEEWILIDEISVDSSYRDYDVNLSGMGYTYLKLASGGAQVRVQSISVGYIGDMTAPPVTDTTDEETDDVTEDISPEETTEGEVATDGGSVTEEESAQNTVEYIFSSYPAGVQYAENEVHVLDDILTLTTNEAHFTTQLRLYHMDNEYGKYHGTAVFESKKAISSLIINAGYKGEHDTLKVWGSYDGESWTHIEDILIATSYADHAVSTAGANYTYIKLESTAAQIRVASVTVNYTDEAPIPPKDETPDILSFGLSLNKGITVKVNYSIPESWLLKHPGASLVFKNEFGEKAVAVSAGKNTVGIDLKPAAINNSLTLILRLSDGTDVNTHDVSVSAYREKLESAYASGALQLSLQKYEALDALLDSVDVYASAADNTLSGLTDDFSEASGTVETAGSIFVGLGASLSESASIRLNTANVLDTYKISVKLGEKVIISDKPMADHLKNGSEIVITGLFPANFDDMVTVTVFDGESTVASVKLSFNAYLKAIYESAGDNDALKCLAVAAYRYGLATEAYINAN